MATDSENLDELPSRAHALFLYKYSSEKQTRIFKFIQDAFRKESCYLLYIAGKQGVKGIRLSMKDSGIDVALHERAGRLRIVDSEEWYVLPGKVQSFKAMNDLESQFDNIEKDAKDSGSDVVLVISEIDMLVRKGFYKNYLEFERTLGTDMKKFKSKFVCAYDEQELRAAGIQQPADILSKLHSNLVK